MARNMDCLDSSYPFEDIHDRNHDPLDLNMEWGSSFAQDAYQVAHMIDYI